MKSNKYFVFLIGSQLLYGKQVLNTVEYQSKEMTSYLTSKLPFCITLTSIITDSETAINTIKKINNDDRAVGVIAWMHTFSPSKNWIRALQLLQKPLLHFSTQYLDHIPYNSIDFNYMNINQSAHGDKEFGFLTYRLNIKNKIICGYWKDSQTIKAIADWMKVANAYNESFNIKVASFGSIMKRVAVTEGDKIEAQIKFGWLVDYISLSELEKYVDAVTEKEIFESYSALKQRYTLNIDNDHIKKDSVLYQLKLYLAIKSFLTKNHYSAFTTNFEDLGSLKQLPGLAVQLLEYDGFGFGAEGDWKNAALDRLLKILSNNQKTGFMEDYTLDYRKKSGLILGSHMLEVDPSLSSTKPTVEVHKLSIGNRNAPARLVFSGSKGTGICISLIDLGTHFKFITYDIECFNNLPSTPHLPIATQYWQPKLGLIKGSQQWIENGGSHHTILSLSISPEQIETLSKLFKVNYIRIK
ncbi:MAG: L-arabinose isomerase [Lactobacillus iners]|jgi:L-arabinose isomerase|nr:L-arabinose isomerase [Lactobacillus iners]MCT7813869.1 L-arabinose isomerase [Lactobacillus iners]MCT7844170.1 L-arabinose isomerase [Lactobacillus iners]